ncbi:hypothetical protein [Bremerella cremea]|uniref:hypothetical protein n=1 Tax=Bremerella cremea TaxID=1031537 RepID=UPI0031E5CCEC
MMRRWCLAGSLLSLLLLSSAGAEIVETEIQVDGTRGERYDIELHAVAPKPPVLEVSLLPPLSEKQPGNAAPLYYRAILSASQKFQQMKDPQDFWADWESWMKMPLDEIPVAKLEERLEPFQEALRETAMAARRSTCEWDFPLRESKTEIMQIYLNEVQECRSLARLLMLRIRGNMAAGKRAEAIADLQTGYALAQNVGGRGFFVNHLVGLAIAQQMHRATLELIALEDSPNIYWSLTMLPTPLIDSKHALDTEMNLLRSMFPEIYHARDSKENFSRSYWDEQLRSLVNRWIEQQPKSDGKPSGGNNLLQSLAYQGMALSQAPRIKKELVSEMGYTQKVVDAMPDSRAVLLHAAIKCDQIRDEVFAPFGLPYYQAAKFYEQSKQHQRTDGFFAPESLVTSWIGSSKYVHIAIARNDQWIEALRFIESLRDYAAAEGVFPARLDELSGLPAPNSSYTGKPFEYERDKKDPTIARFSMGEAGYFYEFVLKLAPPNPQASKE